MKKIVVTFILGNCLSQYRRCLVLHEGERSMEKGISKFIFPIPFLSHIPCINNAICRSEGMDETEPLPTPKTPFPKTIFPSLFDRRARQFNLGRTVAISPPPTKKPVGETCGRLFLISSSLLPLLPSPIQSSQSRRRCSSSRLPSRRPSQATFNITSLLPSSLLLPRPIDKLTQTTVLFPSVAS